MAEETVITPDLKFIRELRGAGAETLKKCYQCATCSVVCPISPDDKPFPRKEMVLAQWGMKEELAANPDIWLCHNCNDCSRYCPRGARPGDVLGVMRQKFVEENSVPSVMGRIVSKPFVALLIPLVLFLVVLGGTGHLTIPEGDIVYSKFVPIPYIEIIFIAAVALAGMTYLMSLSRFWNAMKKNGGESVKGFVPALMETITEFLTHKRFSKCEVNADRKNGHLLVFYAFVGLAITTIWITVYYYLPEPYKKLSPISLADPMKWLANVSALALIVGVGILVWSRLKDKGVNSVNSNFDWTFVIMIVLLAVTGFLTEFIRLAGITTLAYPMYFIHLVFVFYTIVYFPYSKLAHMGYRTLAIAYSKMTNRDVEL
jgi:quinone-modifying oxidoreductase subunit QmoC